MHLSLQIDSDGNGSLSLEELTAALKLSHISDPGIKVRDLLTIHMITECDHDDAPHLG